MDLRFRRTTADRLQIKGVLSEDGTYMTYHGENGEEQTVKISDLFESFEGGTIEMMVTLKSEEELHIAATEDPGTITPAGSDDTDEDGENIPFDDDGNGDDGDDSGNKSDDSNVAVEGDSGIAPND